MELPYRYRPVWAEIDVSAVRHNIELFLDQLGGRSQLLAVVKANGYGHGANIIAEAAIGSGASWLGVASPEEGIALRQNGIISPILLLGEILPEAAAAIIEHDLTATVCTPEVAISLDKEAQKQSKRIPVHVKVDTGMNRLGVGFAGATEFISGLNSLSGLIVSGVFTHFATADEQNEDYSSLQLQRFDDIVANIKAGGINPICHAANSAATLKYPQSHLDMVRVGIGMYGLEPFEGARSAHDLRPVMTLKSRITMMKTIKSGDGVSYGLTFRAARPTTAALVPIGYADGVNRHLSNQAQVCIREIKANIIGRVCMDQVMIDVTDIPGASVGDEVVLFGQQGKKIIYLEEWAKFAGTITYELACKISERVPRVVVRADD